MHCIGLNANMIQEEKNYVNNQLAVRQCGFDGNSIAVKGDGVAAIAAQQATATSSIKSEKII